MNRHARRNASRTHTKAIVLKLIERGADGRPSKAEIIYEEQSTEVRDGTEFAIAFVVPAVFEKTS